MQDDLNTKRIVELGGRRFVIVGTAHVSKKSVGEVEQAIAEQKPDSVAIELDDERLKSLEDSDSWKKMDVVKVLKNKRGFLMLANIVLSSYQKRMGQGAGVKPGDEMVAAVRKCRELDIPYGMVDRHVVVTMRRAWSKNSLWGKCKLLSMLIGTAFSKTEISTEEIENLKQSSEMDSMMSDLATYLPKVKEVLIDERDFYLASHIWGMDGSNVLAIIGAGHLSGVCAHLEKIASGEESPDCSEIESVPPKSIAMKVATWLIPIAIIALIAAGFYIGGIEKGKDLLGKWVLCNGILAGIGAVVGGAHILAVLVAVVGAPITSLCPLVGIGLFTGLVQALVRKPKVDDMENLQADAESLRGFYRNRILRVLMIFFFSSVGSSIGTFAGGASFISIFANIAK